MTRTNPGNNKRNEGQQKGQRRNKLHDNQNNHGSEKNPPGYENFNGEEIKQ